MLAIAGAGYFARRQGIRPPSRDQATVIAEQASDTVGKSMLSGVSAVTERLGFGRIVPGDAAASPQPAPPPSSAVAAQRSPRATAAAPVPEPPPFQAFDLEPLFDAVRQIGSGNAQNEYYLPDLVRMYRDRGLPVETVVLEDATEILGVNSRQELAALGAIMRSRRTDELMTAGVTVIDPATTWIGPDVTVGADTIIHPGVHLEGRTTIGSNVVIQSNVRIVDSSVADGVNINSFCLIVESQIGPGAKVGPFAHLRPQSIVGADAHIGNFVELKKTSMGRGSKANHLAYLGDATIGERSGTHGLVMLGEGVNVGRGTVVAGPSALGARTQVGDLATVDASATWEDARIGDGAVVAHSIIAGGAIVGANARLFNAVLANGARVPDHAVPPPGLRLNPGETYAGP